MVTKGDFGKKAHVSSLVRFQRFILSFMIFPCVIAFMGAVIYEIVYLSTHFDGWVLPAVALAIVSTIAGCLVASDE